MLLLWLLLRGWPDGLERGEVHVFEEGVGGQLVVFVFDAVLGCRSLAVVLVVVVVRPVVAVSRGRASWS